MSSVHALYNSCVRRPAILFLLPILLCSAAVSAQASGDTGPKYKLLSIHVKGLTRLSETAVVQASGLHTGQTAGEADFKQALQKLGDTGMFSNLAYSYQYSNAGCNFEFQTAETDKFVRIDFDNFVWFSDQELLDQLRARVPLFDGQLPLSGNMPEQAAQALSSVLAERDIPGQVEYVESASLGGPIAAYTYKVGFHAITIRNTDFPGSAPSEIPALQAAAKQVVGKDYLRSAMRAQESFGLMPVYLARGYLKAAFADSRAAVVQDGPQTTVDVSFPVMPGLQYKLSDFEIAGNRAFPVDAIRDLIHLKPGEPANAVQLQDDLRAVQKLYGTKGYLAARVQSEPTLDDASSTVRYRLEVTEGDQYRMGELKIDGLANDDIQRLLAQWQMKAGDVFDDSYLTRFFTSIFKDANLERRYGIVPKQSVDSQSKTVSLSLHFVPKN